MIKMAEIFGKGGDPVPVSGQYECSDCGHRETFEKGGTFPPDHHPDKPWALYLATGDLPGKQAG